MATKAFGENGKSKSDGKRNSLAVGDNAEFRGYVNVNLTEDEKAAYDAWASPETIFSVFSSSVSAGVNVAIKPDPKQVGYLASATQRMSSSPNAGLCATARAKDPVTAFGRLMYVLAILSRSERWEDTAPLANPDRW